MVRDCGALRSEGEQNMANENAPASNPVWEARKLLRAARSGTLATSAQGQPFASLVTPACTPDLMILLLISALSAHTRHLRQDQRCSLMVLGTPASANPMTAPRVTVTGVAEPVDDAGLKARFLTIHPYAALYAGFGDFSLWRVRPAAAAYVGGFGKAARLRAAALAPDAQAVAAIAAAEADIIAHCNRDHPESLAAIAAAPGAWRMVALDVDGFDLAQDETVIRIPFSGPLGGPDEVQRELAPLPA
jgi:putative heme iron utilization protein